MSFVDPQTELELTETETTCSLGHVHHKDLTECPSCSVDYSDKCYLARVLHQTSNIITKGE